MQPTELLKDYDRLLGHSIDEQTLDRYKYQDVVTSYIKNSFGIAFLIKGKIKPFAFVVLKNNLSYESYGYNFKQIPVKYYFQLREQAEQEKQDVVFTEEEKEKQIKALCLLEELKDKN